VPTKKKARKEHKGAIKIAEMMYESLRDLPEEERQARVKAIQEIKLSIEAVPSVPALL
jgi:hypothetical protein